MSRIGRIGVGRGLVWAAIAMIASAVADTAMAATAAEPLYQEALRPQIHFTPPQQWMNDPNGLVYADGEYQLFYQYNPYANVWGPMHWGHAVSRDLLHWEHLPIALFPDRNGAIFSGSAVVDASNSSGFGSKEHPPLVAIFTYHDTLRANLESAGFQSQGIAYSLDGGRNWTPYAGNPVLKSPKTRDFRDPKVFWYEPTHRWIMVLAVGDHAALYSSGNLREWQYESDFGKGVGAHGDVWECPDLIALNVAGTTQRRYVLLISVARGAPNGGSGTQYFVGDFDGHRFSADATSRRQVRWVDYGTDDYAGSTWSGAAPGDARTLFIGWMSNWRYARQVPTERWRGTLTLPRQLQLAQSDGVMQLQSEPVRELAAARISTTPLNVPDLNEPLQLPGLDATHAYEIQMQVDWRDGNGMSLTFANDDGEQSVLRFDRASRRMEFDRTESGNTDFEEGFAQIEGAPLNGNLDTMDLQVIVDRTSVEVFVNHGATVLTAVVFPKRPYQKVTLDADRPIGLNSGAVYQLR
ncbi:MAG: glycoside hydrolase family 32 protein [Steroidobacteraceae bacterium]